MNIANVTERFALLSGLDNSEISKWNLIIDDACTFVSSITLSVSLSELDKINLENLAAIYAYRFFCLCDSNNLKSFSAGDIRLVPSADKLGKSAKADNLLAKQLAVCSDIIDNPDFLFGVVTL